MRESVPIPSARITLDLGLAPFSHDTTLAVVPRRADATQLDQCANYNCRTAHTGAAAATTATRCWGWRLRGRG
jgi:hypothetical protein